jgi:transcriptional regulator with XRE-family HTH domain
MRLSPLVPEDLASHREYAAPLNAESPGAVAAPADDSAATPPVATEPVAASTLFDRIHQARAHAGMTKADLARRVGVCLSAAVQWEHPKGTCPTVSHLAQIARVAGVAFEWLATGRGAMQFSDVAADPVALSSFEQRLLVVVRSMPVQRHALVTELLLGLAKKKP